MKSIKQTLVCLIGLYSLSFTSLSMATENISAADNNIIELNKTMFKIYDSELNQFEKNLLNKVPVIVARFSTEGGSFTLYRPHQLPLVGQHPKVSYQLGKAIGHSLMITFNMMTSKSSHKDMALFLNKVKNALQNLDSLKISDSDKNVFRQSLNLISDTLTKSLKKNNVMQEDVNQFVQQTRPIIPKLVDIASKAQIEGQMAVLAEWKKLLGKDWDKTYALTNTIYVTRQNNIIFSILAEWMGKAAINHRLFLFETTSFTTTDQDMLKLWSRIMFDRELGKAVFGDYYLMDSELIANGGRDEIIKVAGQYNLSNILPELEPFNSTDWPWRHNPNSGSGPAELSEEPDFQFLKKQ